MRLLQHTSISDQAEESLISKIKIELGAQNVAKYVQMNENMKQSKTDTENFKKRHPGGVVKGVELSVKILTNGLWKIEGNIGCKLPYELNECCQSFEHYYKNQHTGRNVTWNAGIGDCELRTSFLPKPYTLIVTVYQTALLMLYNNKDIYTFQELVEASGLNEDILSKQLMNLTHPRLGKLLLKDNLKTPKFTKTEKISLNKDFASASLRPCMIPTVVKKVFLTSSKKI
jgi:hypothetical protein